MVACLPKAAISDVSASRVRSTCQHHTSTRHTTRKPESNSNENMGAQPFYARLADVWINSLF